jgi:cobalt-zinc-cadmium efflux system membrane fusion protein
LTGRLLWNEDVTARVFPSVSGRILEVLANPGQRVVAGQVLARLRSRDFGQAQADARRASADLILAERTLVRAKELLERHAAAQKDVEAAEADHDRAVSEKERATAALAGYGGDVAGAGVDGIFSLRAPVGGVVVEKTVGPGQEVRADQVGDRPLFVVSDPRRLWLLLDVTETDVAAFRRDQPVLVHARALPGKGFKGRVEVVGEGLDPSTRTIKVRCAVDNAEALLRAEMYVSADVSLGEAGGVNVPTTAVFMKADRHYLFVEAAPGQFQRREVKIGLEGHGRSVVEAGLAPGEAVVTDGCLLLQSVLEGEGS